MFSVCCFHFRKTFRALAQIGGSDIACPKHQRSGKTQRTEPGQRVLFDILSYLAFIIVFVIAVVLCCFMVLCVLVLFSIELEKIVISRITRPMPGLGLGRQRQSNRLMARTEHKINAINVIKSLTCIIV